MLLDVANEEREHIGEFQRLLDILTGDEPEWMANGVAEVDEMAAELAASAPGAAAPPVADVAAAGSGGEAGAGATIGSLRDQ